MIATLALALVLQATPLPEIPPDTPTRSYVVQPGDSVWSIAAELYGSGDLYPIIYQYNGFVGRPPYLLTPGQTLHLPVLAQGPEGRINWLRHDVRAKPPRSLDWLSAREQMNLWRLYRVSTGDASAAHIVFEDRSDLRLREEALLVIYGGSATATQTARGDKREVRLEQGTLTGGLAELDAAAGKELVVQTPAAEVGIRGRLTQIQSEALSSMVSAYEGSARVTAQGQTVVVAQGQGTVVKKGRRPAPPRALPPAPRWLGPAKPALAVALPGGPPAAFDAAWQPEPAAKTYRVEVAGDATFDKLLYDTEVGHGVTRLRLAELGVGTWVVRVSTRDGEQLESRPGPPQVVTVALAGATRRFTVRDGALEVAGMVELRAPDGLTVAVGDGAPGPAIQLGPGRHDVIWRAGEAVATTPIVVLDVNAELVVVGTTVALSPVDSRGRPVFLPGLVIESSADGELATTYDGQAARATLPVAPSTRPTRLRARWAGGVIAERHLAFAPAPIRPPHPPARPMLPDRALRGWARPYVAPELGNALGFEVGVGDVIGDATTLDVVTRGELALGDLGLDAGLVFTDVRFSDAGTAAAIGDLWLGARWRLAWPALQISPYVAASLPVGPGHEARLTTLEPGLAATIPLGPARVDLRTAAAVRLGDVAQRVGFDGLVALAYGPFAASWRARFDDALASTLGFGFSIVFDQVRIGLGVGYDPGDAAWSGRLAIDIGLQGN